MLGSNSSIPLRNPESDGTFLTLNMVSRLRDKELYFRVIVSIQAMKDTSAKRRPGLTSSNLEIECHDH